MEDILEELVGEIWDEDDDPAQELAEKQPLVQEGAVLAQTGTAPAEEDSAQGPDAGNAPAPVGNAPAPAEDAPVSNGKASAKGPDAGNPPAAGQQTPPGGSPSRQGRLQTLTVYQDIPSVTILNGVDGSYHGQLAYHCALHDFSHCVFRFFLGL